MQGAVRALHARLVSARRISVLARFLSEMIPSGACVLDVGCGDGQLSARIAALRHDISLRGIDVVLQPRPQIEVLPFDGITIPFADSTFDLVMFADVLHHTRHPMDLLAEGVRVAKKYVLLKDHLPCGLLATPTLRVMDWFGNIHQGVALPYNYLPESEWDRLFDHLDLRPIESVRHLALYPWPFGLVFDRSLHFVSLLEKRAPSART